MADPAVSGQEGPPAELATAIEAAKTAASFQDAADALMKQGSLATDPAERERLLKSAYEKELEAHGESKKARVLASGWGQGAGVGIGISASIGMGLGNLVGALLSGVVAVPGGLVGSGVGAMHGPFVKLKDTMSGGNEKAGGASSNDGGKVEAGEDAEKQPDEGNDDETAHVAIVKAARQLESNQ